MTADMNESRREKGINEWGGRAENSPELLDERLLQLPGRLRAAGTG